MIIEDKRPDNLTLGDLINGDVFEAEIEGIQGIFMRTDLCYDSGYTECVNLETGDVVNASRENEVRELKVKLVIE